MVKMKSEIPWWSWFRLARVSALPTALSNILLGYLLAWKFQDAVWHPGDLLSLLGGSAAIYLAGMILNDVHDVETDRIERPDRPLPSGKISVDQARQVGYALLLLGVTLPILGSLLLVDPRPTLGRRFALATLLVLLVLFYNGRLKSTVLGPAIMGGCRMTNLLLGASGAGWGIQSESLWLGFAPATWWLACCLGLYVLGISWIARDEVALPRNLTGLVLGGVLLAMGVAGYALASRIEWLGLTLHPSMGQYFPLIILCIGLPIFRRWINAIGSTENLSVQTVVILGLRSIIVFDAGLCLLVAPGHPEYALTTLGLLIPTLVLGRWLNPT
jgi:4-hydroxybenzoate polyprenyltransferase